MCGIVGYTNFAEKLINEESIINIMAETLTHRGPDASGYWFSDHTILGHRRLIVVDPNGGKQPMTRKKGNNVYTIVYNGELYNTEDIRQQLISKGYTFEGWSDTEVLLIAYIEWGEKCLQKLNGIFAFAIWDMLNESLFIVRDRIGVKPLFYCQQGNYFCFASEIKAILAHPQISPKLNSQGLAEIFVIGPARTPGNGVFSGIYELKPGYCMHIDREGTNIHQYWSLNSHAHDDDFDSTIINVKELVFDAVKRQLVSDVPLCVLLSGGLDSSTIAAIASEVYIQEFGEKLMTFSVDYIGNDRHFQVNEFQPNSDAPWVKVVSDYLDTKHSSLFIETHDLVEALFAAVLARDLPGMTDVDSSLLLFSRWIKNQATVCLSGECADEVFGGYPWFYTKSDPDTVTFPWSRNLNEKVQLYSPELLSIVKPKEYLAERYQEAINEVPHFSGDNPVNAKMRELFYLNLTRWMPTLLDRKDRMSMTTGLEIRVPFCDHKLVEYAWNIPWEMKYFKNREKGILRQSLTGVLPEDVLWRKKSPYPKTHNPMYIDMIRRLTISMLNNQSSPLLPLINKQAVQQLAMSINSETNIPWFGQLMNAPQLLAYLLQIDFWLQKYKINIE